jgi:hypothetical protein
MMPNEGPGEPEYSEVTGVVDERRETLARMASGMVMTSFGITSLLRRLYIQGYRDGYKAAKEEDGAVLQAGLWQVPRGE